LPGRVGAGAALGATVGRIAFLAVFLLAWPLVVWGRRHHEAESRKPVGQGRSPAPAAVRYGLPLLLGVLVLSLGLIPAALGIWLGGVVAGAFGGDPGPGATALPGLGGLLGLSLPFILWHRAR
jgi:hypothetical protein